MSGPPSNANGRAADRLPPPAFPRARRRWRVPAPPPEAVIPEVHEVPEPSEVPEASDGSEERLSGPLPDDVVVLPWEDEDEPASVGADGVFDDEAFISPDTPVIRLSPPTVPEDFEEVMGRGQPASDAPAVDPPEDVELEPKEAAWEDVPVGEELGPEGAAWEEAPIGDEVESVGAAREPGEVEPVWDGESNTSPGALVESVEPVEKDPGVQVLVAAVRRLADDLTSRGEAGLSTEVGLSPFEATLRAYCVGYLEGLRDLESPDPDTPAPHEDPGITPR